MSGMEVFTTTDKDRRDRMFDDLRKNGDALEKKVVKFSGVEEIPEVIIKTPTGPRKQYRSTWSVAYPKSRGAAL